MFIDRLNSNWLRLTKFEKKIFAASPVVREEPERIKLWREEQKTRLEQKDLEEEKKKDELREQAKKELEDWYKHHEEAIAKTKSSNRWGKIF